MALKNHLEYTYIIESLSQNWIERFMITTELTVSYGNKLILLW